MEIIVIIASLCVAGVSIYLATIFAQMGKTLQHLDQKVSELHEKTVPVLENLSVITAKIRTVAENFDAQLDIVRDSLFTLRQTVDEIVDFKRRVQDRLEEPVMESVTFASAIVRGIRTFFDRLRS
ncbi:MAG: hypothetical protein KGZ58_04160 [Ignavibacteriales bacterium]|nr:hypothetical protein [Ignavibacteriales bacterium]